MGRNKFVKRFEKEEVIGRFCCVYPNFIRKNLIGTIYSEFVRNVITIGRGREKVVGKFCCPVIIDFR